MNEDKKINPTPPTHEDIVNAIKVCAMVGGKTRTEIRKMIEDEWLYGHPERIEKAIEALVDLFGLREKMAREVVRAGRHENNMTFAKVLKKSFNNQNKRK